MRRRHLFGFVIVSIVLFFGSTPTSAAEEATWKVGIAKAKITPKKPLWLSGYAARTHAAEGTLHDLWIKVLSLEAPDGHRGVILTGDLLGFPKNMYDRICEELKNQSGLDRSQVLLNASHSHSSPVLEDALYDIYPLDDHQRAMIKEYSAALEKTVVATIAEALSKQSPAVLSRGQGTATFGTNRRENRGVDVVKLRKSGQKPKGPSDHSVPVLAVRTPEGSLRAVLFGYACHCTTLGIYQWNGDYAGFTQIALEEKHPDVQAMFFAGCGADQNPQPRRSVEFCQQHGQELAEAVDEVLARPMQSIEPRLRTAFEFVDLEFGQQPTAEELQADAARGDYRARWASRLLEMMKKNQPFEKSYRYPVQAWKLGSDQLWITLGGEVVVDYALSFKAKYGPATWIAGYTNDVMAYIPSRRIWEEGGYESGAFAVYGLPAVRWTADVEQRITDSVGRLVDQLNRQE